MMPTPTPGPIAARPYPMELSEPVTPSEAARIWDMPVLPSLSRTGGGWPPDDWGYGGCGRSVVLGDGALDEDAGQQHEHVRLDSLDEELERGHHDDHHEGDTGVRDADAVEHVPA